MSAAYTAIRSTTPPLYYKRPEGTPVAYYAVPDRTVESISIPYYPPQQQQQPQRASVTAYSTERASIPAPQPQMQPQAQHTPNLTTRYAPPPPSPRSSYAMPAVTNPFTAQPQTQMLSTPQHPHAYAQPMMPEPANPALYLQQHASTRWSQQQQHEGSRLAALDSEEASLAAEEVALKTRLAELRVSRSRQDEEQLRLSQGWAVLLEREERYYTEPVPELTQDIQARDYQCGVLREREQQAQAHLQYLQQQLAGTEYILTDAKVTTDELQRVRGGFEGVESRRRQCLARAERYFDVESKRAAGAGRAVRRVDADLKQMTTTGPLAQLQLQDREKSGSGAARGGIASRSTSRCVTFAQGGEKSIVLDLSRDVSSEPAEEEQGSSSNGTYGLSGSSGSASGIKGVNVSSASYVKAREVDGNPVCLGMEDDEEESGLGGTSVAFSLNNSTNDLLMKRRKMEPCMAL